MNKGIWISLGIIAGVSAVTAASLTNLIINQESTQASQMTDKLISNVKKGQPEGEIKDFQVVDKIFIEDRLVEGILTTYTSASTNEEIYNISLGKKNISLSGPIFIDYEKDIKDSDILTSYDEAGIAYPKKYKDYKGLVFADWFAPYNPNKNKDELYLVVAAPKVDPRIKYIEIPEFNYKKEVTDGHVFDFIPLDNATVGYLYEKGYANIIPVVLKEN